VGFAKKSKVPEVYLVILYLLSPNLGTRFNNSQNKFNHVIRVSYIMFQKTPLLGRQTGLDRINAEEAGVKSLMAWWRVSLMVCWLRGVLASWLGGVMANCGLQAPHASHFGMRQIRKRKSNDSEKRCTEGLTLCVLLCPQCRH